jgi:hypothetical protein
VSAGGCFHRVPVTGAPVDLIVRATGNPGAPYVVRFGGQALALYVSQEEAETLLAELVAAMQERARVAALAAADAAQAARQAAGDAHRAQQAAA